MIEIIQTIERFFSPEKVANEIFSDSFTFPLNFHKLPIDTLSRLEDSLDRTLFRCKFQIDKSTLFYWIVVIRSWGNAQLFALDPSCYDVFSYKPRFQIAHPQSFPINRESLQAPGFLYLALQKDFDIPIPEIKQFEIHQVTIGEEMSSEVTLLPVRFAT